MCVRNYNSYSSKDSITVDYMVIGGRYSTVIKLIKIILSCLVACKICQIIHWYSIASVEPAITLSEVKHYGKHYQGRKFVHLLKLNVGIDEQL